MTFTCFGALILTQSISSGTVSIRSTKFWDVEKDEEFVIIGMAYQPRENDVIIDPISDSRQEKWTRDLKLMKDLDVNVVRVYEV